MIFDKLTLQSDIIGTAMQASLVKNDVIVNNIANVDTPGFKTQTVSFENELTNAINSYKLTGDFNLGGLSPKITPKHSGHNYRIDENNVDIDLEMVSLYENSIKYDTMAGSVMNNYERINLVISSR